MPGAPLEAVLANPLVVRLARSLADQPGTQLALSDPLRRAAVALILRSPDGAELEALLIKRAEHEGDPWSGHVALPGGRHEAEDGTLEATAIRETREETAVDLTAQGRILGVLDELVPRTPVLPPIAIAPYVAALGGDVALTLSEEVDAAFWVPLSAMRSAAAWSDERVDIRGTARVVPAFRYEHYLIWGLTERILRQFLGRLER